MDLPTGLSMQTFSHISLALGSSLFSKASKAILSIADPSQNQKMEAFSLLSDWSIFDLASSRFSIVISGMGLRPKLDFGTRGFPIFAKALALLKAFSICRLLAVIGMSRSRKGFSSI